MRSPGIHPGNGGSRRCFIASDSVLQCEREHILGVSSHGVTVFLGVRAGVGERATGRRLLGPAKNLGVGSGKKRIPGSDPVAHSPQLCVRIP